MTSLVVHGPARVSGEISVPGDKSISHRALMLGALASGQTTLRNVAPGDDVSSTIGCLEAYGVAIDRDDVRVLVDADGIGAWMEPGSPLDCGNSGTTMRVLAGLAAHKGYTTVFDGDASLRRRPMDRIARPLELLGAHVGTEDGFPPIQVRGGRLVGTTIWTEIASAQVKTCALFAGLGAEGRTTVIEPTTTRDHTERMLAALGSEISEEHGEDGHRVSVERFVPPPFELRVPGDVSSAAFLVAAAVMCGEVVIEGVGVNPARVGFLEALAEMGGNVAWDADEERMNEPVGSIVARASDLTSITIDPARVPSMHDELPLLAVLATQSQGETIVRGARELRVKESDRIATMVEGLDELGADIEELPDGFVVRGPSVLRGATVNAAGDHRIAMALAVAGLVAKGRTRVEGFESVGISWPSFDEALAALGVEVQPG